ncbi:hypothetical protein CARUB_v10016179mg, partial [Capsella rubella]
MAHRYSRSEKAKWPVGPSKQVRRSLVQIPAEDNSAIIKAHRLSLIGKVTNPHVQKTRAVIDFLPQFWNLEGRVTGRDLGRDTFLFRFIDEEDLEMVLRKGPYHFKQWMLILQKWEPIVSQEFPSEITFWIEVIGIPVLHETEKTLSTIGNALGHYFEADVPQARIRVGINGLHHLEMNLEITLPSGDLKTVDFVYEKLEKHCFACFSLSHEKKHCPFFSEREERTTKPFGTNQLKTLDRLGEDKRRQDDRKRSRSSLEEDDRGGRVSTKDLREWIRNHPSPPRRPPAYDRKTPFRESGTSSQRIDNERSRLD